MIWTYSIVQKELQCLQNQYEIVAIYVFLYTDCVSWGNWTIFLEIWQNEKCSIGFNINSEFGKVQQFEVKKFDYLICSIIWFNLTSKMLNWD